MSEVLASLNLSTCGSFMCNFNLPILTCPIYAHLDSIESDDQGEIENIMNASHTEFIAEDETIICNQ